MWQWLNRKENRNREHLYFWERVYFWAMEKNYTQLEAAVVADQALFDRMHAATAQQNEDVVRVESQQNCAEAGK